MQVRDYFPDLSNKRVVSAFGLVHSRFATNTFPSWKLAQPFRYIAHNGEINTLQGNLNWLKTSEKGFTSPYFSKEEMEMLLPIIPKGKVILPVWIMLLNCLLCRPFITACNDDADTGSMGW